ARQPRPRGPRLAIVTNAGGPGVLAADTLLTSGGQLAPLSPATAAALDAMLPINWGQHNPIDLQSDATPERYDQAVEALGRDQNADGVLVILTPTMQSNPTRTAELIQRHSRKIGKPLLASWMGGEATAEGERLLQRAGVPAFDYPDTAAHAFQAMWQYSENLRSLYETPALLPEDAADSAAVEAIIALARAEGRQILNEIESKALIAAYGLAACETQPANDAQAAVAVAEQIGYPVVLKLLAADATHKTDFGGVRLNLHNATAVRAAYAQIISSAAQRGISAQRVSVQPMITGAGYELMLGSSVDPQFGPVVVFGVGGDLVEILRDRAIGLPPLNSTLARRLIEQTRIAQALPGVRGRAPIDPAALERIVARFSQLVADQPTIKAIDINPLYVESGRMLALDARVVLHDAAQTSLPKLAIRPYPAQYISQWQLKGGGPVTIRPIRPEDEPQMVDFHKALSEQSVYYRFFRSITFDRRIEHERLARVCFLDYDRELALVAVQQTAGKDTRIIGVGRLSHQRGSDDAEFALLIADGFQGHGLGTELLTRLVDIGRREQFRRIVGYMLPENRGMIRVAERLGFRIKHALDLATATLDL
ncbi:MAG: GNAT family N-acetyltransferase, partial [Roseiflexaceae bacterium]|nr:GNAT family N-acetyltransferase [Roseiflexaceae bacterium]